MKKVLAAVAVSATLALTGTATFAANMKLGVVDYMSVFNQAPQGKAKLENLKSNLTPKIEKIKQEQAKLAKAIQSFEKNKPTMSKAQVEKKTAELTKKQQAFQQQVMTLRQSEMQNEQKAAQDFEKALQGAIAKVGKSGGYDMILNSQAAPFSKDAFDVTKSVVKAM